MIKESNTRTQLTIDKELYIKAQNRAKEENRSFNNYVINLIIRDLKNAE